MATMDSDAAAPTSTLRATPQGGILEGMDPSIYNSRYPIVTFIIQAGIILIFCRIIHWPLSKIRQPKVIAEIIGGIILGPSVLGRIPGFSDAIFPPESIPNLNLVANLGLVLFLFLVGLELDVSRVRSHWKIALTVGICDITLPFALGCAIAWGLYNEFSDEEGVTDIEFPVFMLFIGIAIAITAFPVLCRILTELQLLNTPVGVITLSSGVGNDVIAWILLALCVALVNANSGITSLWILLTTVAYGVFLCFVVRPLFRRYLRQTGALENGPSQTAMTITILIALVSAFFTEIIGVHAIFGAFMAGIICPHEGGFAIKVTEKIEDLIATLFLPLFFTLSGLSTNIGLLDTGMTWAYVIGVIAVAFSGKFIGGTVGARINGLLWRESMAIGSLMSCKGLVEIIVLNIGLQAEILSTRTFTIFVVMALVTTFATTPLVQWIYPQSYQRKVEAWRRGEIDWDTGLPPNRSGDSTIDAADALSQKVHEKKFEKVLVYLRLDSIPTLLGLLSVMGISPQSTEARNHPSRGHGKIEKWTQTNMHPHSRNLKLHGLRLTEHNDRGSTDMKVLEADSYKLIDPFVRVLRAWGQAFGLRMEFEVRTASNGRFAATLVGAATDQESDLLLVPWAEVSSSSSIDPSTALKRTASRNSIKVKAFNESYCTFVRNTFDMAKCATAVLIPPSLDTALEDVSQETYHHIYLPYFAIGSDDTATLRLVLQLAQNPNVTATILGLFDAADSAIHAEAAALFATMQENLTAGLANRVIFEKSPPVQGHRLDTALRRVETEIDLLQSDQRLLIALGRHAGILIDSEQPSNLQVECLGLATAKFVEIGSQAGLLVLQC